MALPLAVAHVAGYGWGQVCSRLSAGRTTVLSYLVLGFAILFGAVTAYKALLQHRAELGRHDEESRRAIALSQEETKRLEAVVNAIVSRERDAGSTEE